MHWLTLAFLLPFSLPAAPAPLSIVNAALHQFEDGPILAQSFAFTPGETVFLSFQVAGYQAEGEDKTVRLDYQLNAIDASGVRLVETKKGQVKADLADQDKEWLPKARWEFLLPPLLDSGSYRVSIDVKDAISGQEAHKEVSFQVRGHEVEKSDALAVRNFRFLRSEEDANPLKLPDYKPGDVLWARFDITGFKLGEKNRLQVEYDIAVATSAGKTLFTQQNAAVEQQETFYPRRYVPGTLSLNLEKGIKPGEYVILLSVRDSVGSQTAESKQAFRVED
jgi:hypothetical protein